MLVCFWGCGGVGCLVVSVALFGVLWSWWCMFWVFCPGSLGFLSVLLGVAVDGVFRGQV